jgi:hypothetical protein
MNALALHSKSYKLHEKLIFVISLQCFRKELYIREIHIISSWTDLYCYYYFSYDNEVKRSFVFWYVVNNKVAFLLVDSIFSLSAVDVVGRSGTMTAATIPPMRHTLTTPINIFPAIVRCEGSQPEVRLRLIAFSKKSNKTEMTWTNYCNYLPCWSNLFNWI